MSNKYAILSTQNVGGTFLDWSIHWLSGATKFYNCDLQWIDLVHNPLTKINAHLHKSNHPNGWLQTYSSILQLNQLNTTQLLSIYGCFAQNPEQTTSSIIEDYAKIWDCCSANNFQIINLTSSNSIYHQFIRNLDMLNTKFQFDFKIGTEFKINRIHYYFAESILYQDNIWDFREFISLNIRPYRTIISDSLVNFSILHHHVDSQQLFHYGKNTLFEVFNFLKLKLDIDRLESWLPIYYQWQEFHFNALRFSNNLDYICDCIINNYYYDLNNYSLDIWQEAIIQHLMIYKYNLNFKTFELEKFPNNTQDLHKLLEPNFHKVDDIYNVLK